VVFCLSRFSCLTDHGFCVAVRQVLFLSLDVWTLFSFGESNISSIQTRMCLLHTERVLLHCFNALPDVFAVMNSSVSGDR